MIVNHSIILSIKINVILKPRLKIHFFIQKYHHQSIVIL